MEELSRQLVEMMRLQQTQKLQRQNMERQKENDERQLLLMKFVEEKQSKMQKELNKQRGREEERKEFNEKILEMQTQADERLELLTPVIANTVPEEDLTFETYFRRIGDVFRIGCKSWSEQMKVRLQLQKLGAAEHKFVDYIIPKQTSELSFDEAVKSLMELYCQKKQTKTAYFIKDGNVST